MRSEICILLVLVLAGCFLVAAPGRAARLLRLRVPCPYWAGVLGLSLLAWAAIALLSSKAIKAAPESIRATRELAIARQFLGGAIVGLCFGLGAKRPGEGAE